MKLTALTLIALLITQPVMAGLGSKDAMYMGGTFAGVKERQEGKLDTTNPDAARFVVKKMAVGEIPYDKITSLEYGQKAGRRIGATIGWGVTTLGIAALPMLLSKKRKHYLTIGYTDAVGRPQGVVFELGKDVTRATLMVLETRSGKQIEYESEDAKQHVGN